MRYREILEATDTVLYHGTTVERLYDILDSGTLAANTGHTIGKSEMAGDWAIRPRDMDSRGYINGVSLTRDVAFARRWANKKQDGVVLVLDAVLLRQRHRIVPVAFWQGRNARWVDELARAAGNEAEEFVIGPIRQVTRFIREIEVAQKVLDADHVLGELPAILGVRLKVI